MIFAKTKSFFKRFGTILGLARKHHLFIRNYEFSVTKFIAASLLAAVILVCFFKWLSGEHFVFDPKACVDALVSILNFVGVMYIARGVILLRREADDLVAMKKNPKAFTRRGVELFLASSRCCETGSLMVLAAFLIDMIDRAVM
jgi:hypothetical protein